MPEVNLDDSQEVRIDHRALAPNRDSHHRRSAAPRSPWIRRPASAGRPRRRRTAKPRRAATTTAAVPPVPPPRSANIRVTTAQHSSLIGGRYQIVKRIGQGGMGKVYEVNHIHLSRRSR